MPNQSILLQGSQRIGGREDDGKGILLRGF